MIIRRIHILLMTVALVFASCQETFDAPVGDGLQRFSLEVESYADRLPDEPSGATEGEITQLVAGIYDRGGALLSSVIMSQSPDLTQFTVQGLADGEYTAVFIGVAERRSADEPVLVLPARIEDEWLAVPAQGLPHNNEYLYAKSRFTIRDNQGVSSKVTLARVVGRVDIEPDFTDGLWNKGSIASIVITFEDGSLYTTCNADGTYGASTGKIVGYEAIDDFNIYTLPSVGEGARHGSLVITGRKGDGSPYKIFYEFDLIVQANRRATIRPSYALENDQFGTVRVYDMDRNALNSKKFFQDPTDGAHHYREIPKHSFKMNQLLKLTFQNNNKELKAQFYSVLPVKNVTVYIRRPSDLEFFEVAWFESMQPLEERTITLPTSADGRVYRTESGGAVFVDKMINNFECKYVSTDPHMKKIASIRWPCKMMFVNPTADTLYHKEKQLAFRAVYAREAVALWTNLGYMYSHPLWEREMLEAEKQSPFTEKGREVSIKDVFIPQIFNKESNNFAVLSILNMGKLLGLATVGTGDYLALRPDKVYVSHYLQDQDTWEKLYNVGLHEYGHNLGYGHDGDFTYGKCTDINVKCMRALVNELPYPSSKLLNSRSNPNLYEGIPNRWE